MDGDRHQVKITALASRAEVAQVAPVLGIFRGDADLAVGVGSTLWPHEYQPLGALFVTVTPGGYYIAVDAQPVMFHGYVRRLVEDGGDRLGLCPSFEGDAVLWVEHALTMQDVYDMRNGMTAEEHGELALTASTMRQQNAKYDPLNFHDLYWTLPRKEWLVALQMHDTAGGRVPDCWMAQPPEGSMQMFWSARAEQQRQEFMGRYNWRQRGWLEWATNENVNSTPFTRTALYRTTARVAIEAVEQVRERILAEQGIPA